MRAALVELCRALAAHLPDGSVLLFDRDLRYLAAEGDVRRSFGLTREGLEGQPACAEAEPHYRAVLAGEQREWQIERGGRCFAVCAAPLRDAAGEVVAGSVVVRDLTAQAQAADAL